MMSFHSFGRRTIVVLFVLVASMVITSCASESPTAPTREQIACSSPNLSQSCISGTQVFGPQEPVRLKMEDGSDSPVTARLTGLTISQTPAGPRFEYGIETCMDSITTSPGGGFDVYLSNSQDPSGEPFAHGALPSGSCSVVPDNSSVPVGMPGVSYGYTPFSYFPIKATMGFNGIGRLSAVGAIRNPAAR